MTHPIWTVILVCALLAGGGVAVAQQSVPRVPEVLPLEEETQLALSAAPEHLREEAGVYALTETGVTQVRESRNDFTCIVNRDHPLNRKPVCYDAEGAETVLPAVVYFGELLRVGTPLPAIRDSIAAGFASGRFIAPRRPGIAYMLSHGIRNYNARTGQVGPFPPHLMFYAPNLTNADIGAPAGSSEYPWMPFVAYQGPHGFMVVVVNPPPEE